MPEVCEQQFGGLAVKACMKQETNALTDLQVKSAYSLNLIC